MYFRLIRKNTILYEVSMARGMCVVSPFTTFNMHAGSSLLLNMKLIALLTHGHFFFLKKNILECIAACKWDDKFLILLQNLIPPISEFPKAFMNQELDYAWLCLLGYLSIISVPILENC